jgi:putative FmdB family regulatory protein
MPRYEYKCEGCGEVFEIQQKFADEPLTVHQKCGGRVERLISAPSLRFKGSGWYVNDYAKGGGNGSKKSDTETKPATTDTAAKSETKPSESKPATGDKSKTDTKS